MLGSEEKRGLLLRTETMIRSVMVSQVGGGLMVKGFVCEEKDFE